MFTTLAEVKGHVSCVHKFTSLCGGLVESARLDDVAVFCDVKQNTLLLNIDFVSSELRLMASLDAGNVSYGEQRTEHQHLCVLFLGKVTGDQA